jgi:hypothetical protein
MHGLHHAVDGRVQEPLGGLRIEVPDQRSGTLGVGKQDRDLLALAFQALAGIEDFFGEMCRDIRQRSPLRVCGRGRSWRRGRACFSRPDEATAVILDRAWVCVQEFVLERLQVVVVQTELQLEGAIGHAASALEHRRRLIEHLLEGHGRLSTALAMTPGESKVRHGGVSMEHVPRVYQEYGGVAGEIALLCRDPGMGARGQRRKRSQ